MSMDVVVAIQTCLIAAGVMVLLAAVPWGYSVHGRLTRIESDVRTALKQERRIERLERYLQSIRTQLSRLRRTGGDAI